MDLTLQTPGDYLFVQGLSEQGIKVDGVWHDQALVLSPGSLIADWGPADLADLDDTLLQPVFDLNPEIVLLGTGEQQKFLSGEQLMLFYKRGIGVEVMTTAAACRTYNVLASEERRVVAALMPHIFP